MFKSLSFWFLVGAIMVFNSCGEPAVDWQEARTGAGEQKSITLADGSTAYLNENSMLKYPVEFTQKQRNIEFKGMAFFDVQKNEKPFVITTEHERVKTNTAAQFQVNEREAPTSTSVNVVAGGVTLETLQEEGKIELTQGVKGIFEWEQKKLQQIHSATPSDMFWHTQRLYFKELPMSRVLDDLKNVFGTEISISNTDLLKCRFSYEANNPTITDVLEAFEKEFGSKVYKESETFYSLIGGSCEQANN